MTADDAMQALRDAIRADLIATLQAELDQLHPATGDDDDDYLAMDQNYLDGFGDAILALEKAA